MYRVASSAFRGNECYWEIYPGSPVIGYLNNPRKWRGVQEMITIGIPTYNRAESLAITLRDVAFLNYSGGAWELVVVDNKSNDSTPDICRRYMPTNGRYIYEARQGVSHARNRVLDEARGDLVLLIDDDVSPDRNWLNAMSQASARYPEMSFFGGSTRTLLPQNVPAWYRQTPGHPIVPLDLSDTGPSDREYCFGEYARGANMGIRRSAYLKHGGFDPELGIVGRTKIGGEEPDLCARYMKAGLRGAFISAAHVMHRVAPDVITPDAFRRNYRAAGLSDMALTDKWHEGARLFGVPRWLLPKLIAHPFWHLGSAAGHGLAGQKTAAAYHLLHLCLWYGRMTYIVGNRCPIGK